MSDNSGDNELIKVGKTVISKNLPIKKSPTALAIAEKSIQHAYVRRTPFRHFILNDVLPAELCRAITDLPITPAAYTTDHNGKREQFNDQRVFLSPENQEKYPVMGEIARMFQSDEIVNAMEDKYHIDLTGSCLRVEYCQDTAGFYLKPHMDIKEKLITMQIFLDEYAPELGTTLYEKKGDGLRAVTNVPCKHGSGYAFVPETPNSFHGFDQRDDKFKGTRHSLIVNFVRNDNKDKWRSVHELAFPNEPIKAPELRAVQKDRGLK